MRECVPNLGDQQQHGACADIDHPVQNTFPAIPGDGDANLLAASSITAIEGRCFCDDDLVKHQDDRVRVRPEAMFKPPLACCQCGSLKARTWRGRFQPTCKRCNAKLTL